MSNDSQDAVRFNVINDPPLRPPGAQAQPSCGCGVSRWVGGARASGPRPYVVGRIDSAVGPVPQITSELNLADHLGSAKARWGVGRMSYRIEPGLYALGVPDPESPVLVTANYKMSFDQLRHAVSGRDLWILVLETGGINVWCAAGKGTFGTDELVHRIEVSGLADVVTHRTVIVPQLGAPGVTAHEVKARSGFRVLFGPIEARDVPAYLKAGNQATPEMRRKAFPLAERVVLIPVELVHAIAGVAMLIPIFLFLGGLGGAGSYWSNVWHSGLLAATALLVALLGGAVLTPILLPWLPGRAFSLKAVPVGLLLAGVLVALWMGVPGSLKQQLEAGAWLLLIPALTTFLAMSFTGASTFTSLSGVRREMRTAVPLQIGAAVVGLGLWIGARFAG